MNLQKRLTLAIFGVLLLFAVNVVTFAIGNKAIRESLDAASDAAHGQVNASGVRQELDALHKRLLVLATLRDSVGTGVSTAEGTRARGDILLIRQRIQRMTRNTNADSYDAYQALLGSAELMFQDWDRFLRQLRDPPPDRISIEDMKARYAQTIASLKDFESAVLAVSSRQSAQVEKAGRIIGRITIVVFLASIFLTSVLGFLLIRHTNESLRLLREGTVRIGSGALEYQIPVLSQDEFGQLARAFNDMAGRVRAAVAEVEAARRNADRANAAKSSFLANMSHELRTPLNAIIGYSEMLVEMTADDAELPARELSGDLQRIHTAGQHLLSLINNVLDLSKIETGKMTLYRESFDAVAALRELAATMQTLATRNKNRIEVNGSLDRFEIVTDQTRFRQIFANLLSNACKFTEKGVVSVSFEEFGDQGAQWLRVKVADTGIGMEREQLAAIFDAFVQADSSTTKKYGGTGLGLALSRQFCTLLGGRIRAESEPGKGSVFTVELPLDALAASIQAAPASEPDRAAETEPAPPVETPGAVSNVLVIDDDADARELTARALRQEGCHVWLAEGGKQGLRLAREHRPDLIVLDLSMPEMDGWEVLSVLKDNVETRDIPVVLQSMHDARDEGLQRGAAEFIEKPVNRRRLAETLSRLTPRDRSGHVLLIETASRMRDELIAELGSEGWYVSVTEQASEALAIARQHQPDLILLSLELPSEDVFSLSEELSRHQQLRRIPVYVLAGAEMESDTARRLESRLDKLVVQPRADIASLLDRVAR
jgi:signal transduction histidine kinase/DNA-binding response OmpR family regulator